MVISKCSNIISNLSRSQSTPFCPSFIVSTYFHDLKVGCSGHRVRLRVFLAIKSAGPAIFLNDRYAYFLQNRACDKLLVRELSDVVSAINFFHSRVLRNF